MKHNFVEFVWVKICFVWNFQSRDKVKNLKILGGQFQKRMKIWNFQGYCRNSKWNFQGLAN